MKFAIIILMYLITTSVNANNSTVFDATKKQQSKIMEENIKKIKPATSEGLNCQPDCKPGRFSKRK